ncbi:MAG: methyltransferase domain-containing protein [bacterium]
MKKSLRTVKQVLDKVLGTKVDEIYWRSRKRTWAKACISSESLLHPHRKFLIERIDLYSPFESLIEIGCGAGPNLYLIAKRFPKVKLYGIDINKNAVEVGRNFFAAEGINSVSLGVGKSENLCSFSDKSIDLALTDAVLIYIAPDKIEKVIKQLVRVVRKTLIFVEWHSNSQTSIYNDHWAHNYKNILKDFILPNKIKFTKIPENIWAGDWAKYGYIIESTLKP